MSNNFILFSQRSIKTQLILFVLGGCKLFLGTDIIICINEECGIFLASNVLIICHHTSLWYLLFYILFLVRPNLLCLKSISVSSLSTISHITCAKSGSLFISGRGGISQVDMEGIERQMIRQNFSFGEHTITESGDILFIKEEEVCKVTTSGEFSSLLKLECKPVSIYSEKITDGIWVGSHRKLTRYGRVGNKIRDIVKDSRGQYLYVKPVYITELISGNIAVSDSGKGSVVAVNLLGKYCFEYKGHHSQSEFHPRGICSNQSGDILVCNSSIKNPSVHLLDENGQFIDVLLTSKELIIQSPCALCLKEDKFLFVGYLHNTINVYKYPSDKISDESSANTMHS